MKNTKFIVKTNSKIYPIYFGNNIINRTGRLVNENLPGVKKICIISDKKLPKFILKKLVKSLKNYEVKIFELAVNEKIKSFKIANKIIEELLKNNFNRSDCVIGLGGGIIGDLSAFISNLTKRGLKFINIPSTLLAQVDASIGGKTGINSKQGKNLIGTFYQPEFILSDVSILKSLPQREMISGYAEILKHSLILDKKLFLWLSENGKEIIYNKNNILLKNAIIKSCKIKCNIVNKDENEKNLRMILNFGHTFAHGFEAANKFSNKLNHGEAVLLGMIIASVVSNKNRGLSSSELELIKNHYIDLKLPMNLKKYFKKMDINKIIYFMKKDKKNFDKKINLILLKKIGKADWSKKSSLSVDKIKKILKSFLS